MLGHPGLRHQFWWGRIASWKTWILYCLCLFLVSKKVHGIRGGASSAAFGDSSRLISELEVVDMYSESVPASSDVSRLLLLPNLEVFWAVNSGA